MRGPAVRWRAPQVLVASATFVLILALLRQATMLDRPPYPLAVALTAGYLAWLYVEAPVTFAPRDSWAPDDRTLVPYGVTRMATAATACLGPVPWTHWTWWMVLPPVLFIGGIALRLSAVRSLGRFYSHRVQRQSGHRVITGGPYALVRHPAYLGMLIAHAGLVALFANPFSVLGLLLLAAAISWRIVDEERMLRTLPEYDGYAAATARLIPGVW